MPSHPPDRGSAKSALRYLVAFDKRKGVEMSVVVAYQETAVGNLALREAAKEANLRET